MTWANGLPTILCEECGHELPPEMAHWYQGEVAVCKSKDTCTHRQRGLADIKAQFNATLKDAKEAMTAELTHRDTFPNIEIPERNPNEYQDKARKIVLDYYNENYLPLGQELHISQVYVTNFTKTLQNWKALVATDVPGDGMYFEVTHNGDKRETYLDAYVKAANVVIPY